MDGCLKISLKFVISKLMSLFYQETTDISKADNVPSSVSVYLLVVP